MYVWCNVDMHSCNRHCSGKAMIIAQPVCVFVALGIQHAMWMHHFVICVVPRSTTFFHIISQTAQFSKKIPEHKMCIWFYVHILPETFFLLRSFEQNMSKNVRLSSCTVPFILEWLLWNLSFMDNLKKKFSNIRFHENLSSGRWVVPCRQTDGWTDMTKLIVAFCNLVKAPKNALGCVEHVSLYKA